MKNYTNFSIKKLISQHQEVHNIEENEKYTDHLFPPDDSSIFSTNIMYKNRNPQALQSFFPIEETFLISQFSCLPKDQKYTWERLSDLNIEYNMLKNPGSEGLFNDIIPGEIGNCYFTSALKFLSEVPKRIFDIIPDIINKNGYFEVSCYINGQQCKIIVDDYFPRLNDNFTFCRLNPKTLNIWPLVLEKVWAKVNRSYEDTIFGCIGDAFEFLTPCPIKKYYHDIQYDNLFTKISKAIDEGFIVCCDIHSTNDNVLLRKLGVISNHAYNILGHGEIRDSKGKCYNLLKIYNPFHITTWIGNWSPDSAMWTSEYKKHLNYDPDIEKNVYWLEMADYLKFYTTTYICYLFDNYYYTSKKINIGGINDIFTCAKITINSESGHNSQRNLTENLKKTNAKKLKRPSVTSTNSFIIVNFKSKRIQMNYKNKENYDYLFVNISIFQKEGDKLRYIDSVCGKEERMFIPLPDIHSGEYVVAINFPCLNKNKFSISNTFSINPNRPNNITVGLYSKIEEQYVSITEYSQEKFDRVILRSLIEKSKKNAHLYYFDKEKENDTSRSINFENERGSFGYLVLENRSEGCLYESVNFCEFVNVNLISFIIQSKKNKPNNHVNAIGEGIIEAEDNLIEDVNTRRFIEQLSHPQYTNITDESKVSSITIPKGNEPLSQDNPYEILLKVSSNSTCVLIFEKCDEYSAIDIHSQIAFRYPLYVILKETKTNSAKTRLNYKGRPIEIYECIIEHSSGVLFYYKNKTKDMSVKINIVFKEMNNLKFGMLSDEIGKSKAEITDKTDKKETTLTIDAGENKFVEMRAKNIFECFTYSFEMNYFICYSKAKHCFKSLEQ